MAVIVRVELQHLIEEITESRAEAIPCRREIFIKPDPLVRLVNKRSDLEEDERWLETRKHIW